MSGSRVVAESSLFREAVYKFSRRTQTAFEAGQEPKRSVLRVIWSLGLIFFLLGCGRSKPQIQGISSILWTNGLVPGTFVNTQLSGGILQLTPTGRNLGTGSFTSAQIASEAQADWLNLQWRPERPYGKELPANGQNEIEYSKGRANMSANVFLLSFNENQTFQDRSGKDQQVTWIGPPNPALLEGKYKDALEFTAGDEIEITSNPDLNFSGSDHTFEAWVKVTGEGRLFSKEDTVLGQVDVDYGFVAGPGGDLLLYANNGSTAFQSTTGLAADQWAHVAYVRRGDQVEIYVNGQLLEAQTLASGQINDSELKILAGDLTGKIDELAVYRRALSGSEISDRYQRGAIQVLIQYKTCNQTCSGQSFLGPDKTSATFYSEAENPHLGFPKLSLIGAQHGDRIQLRVTLKTDDPALTPRLQDLQAGYFLLP